MVLLNNRNLGRSANYLTLHHDQWGQQWISLFENMVVYFFPELTPMLLFGFWVKKSFLSDLSVWLFLAKLVFGVDPSVDELNWWLTEVVKARDPAVVVKRQRESRETKRKRQRWRRERKKAITWSECEGEREKKRERNGWHSDERC